MTDITPSWTTQDVIPEQLLLSGTGTAIFTLDLTEKHGAYLFPRIGRDGSGTLVLNFPVEFIVTRRPAVVIDHLSHHVLLQSGTGEAEFGDINTNSPAGGRILKNVVPNAKLDVGENMLIAPGSARQEWNRLVRKDTNDLILESPLRFTHLASNFDWITGKADVYAPQWLPGGSVYTMLFSNERGGKEVRVHCPAQIYDKDVAV